MIVGDVTIPMRTRSPGNNSQGTTRQGMIIRARIRREQRNLTALVVSQFGKRLHALLERQGQVLVTLTRIAPSSGLDADNLAGSLKSVRDGVTDALGLKNDSDPRLTWAYAQKRGAHRQYAVHVLLVGLEREEPANDAVRTAV